MCLLVPCTAVAGPSAARRKALPPGLAEGISGVRSTAMSTSGHTMIALVANSPVLLAGQVSGPSFLVADSTAPPVE